MPQEMDPETLLLYFQTLAQSGELTVVWDGCENHLNLVPFRIDPGD
jgi:hypothetical protein